MTVYKITLDKIIVYEMTSDKLNVYGMTLEKMTLQKSIGWKDCSQNACRQN